MKKESKKVVLSALLFSSAFVLAMAQGKVNVNAQSASVELGQELTANLIKDGSFENVTEENLGVWEKDVSSEMAGTKGSVEIATDAHTGAKAITLKGAGNDSGYPEISQKLTVLPNTYYYITLRVRNNNTAMSSANLFFGFASETRTAEEKIYGEQHRWSDNSVDKDQIYKKEDTTWSNHNGYSLYSARIKTGNETKVRFYIRVQKMNVTIDDVSITYAGNVVPAGKTNLLQNPGFEESNSANALNKWELIGEPSTGFSAGIDDVRATSAYTAGGNMQDKQIEGYNALYLVAASGAEGDMTIGQAVTVETNKNYGFYTNLSKWGEVKATAGVQKVTMGILGSDKETVLTRKVIDGANISLARYMMASVVANVGENTTVYPFIKVETIGFGTYGAGLYVDESYFFETSLGLPEGKTNLLSNGDLATNSDGWYEVGGSSQLGWEAGGSQGKGYVSNGNIWLSQWSPLDGIVQSVTLEANKLYKATAYMRTYFDNQWGTVLPNYDDLYSPVSLLVIKGNDETVSEAIATNDDLTGLQCVARQNVRFDRDDAYMPVNLIFSVAEAGEYSIFAGFEGGVYENTWQGGVQIGGVSLYETSMEELAVIEETIDYSTLVVNTSDDVEVEEGSITIAKAMTVAEFNEDVYAAPGFELKVLDAQGAELTSGNLVTGCVVKVFKGQEEIASYAVTVNASEEQTSEPTSQEASVTPSVEPSVAPTSEPAATSEPTEEPAKKKGCKGEAATSLLGLITLAGSLLLKKRR